MKKIWSLLLVTVFISSSCRSVKNIFTSQTPHEKYADKLEDKHLDDTPEGRQWLLVSKRILENAQGIQLPYRQNGYFRSDKPGALALQFRANFGERITFNLDKNARTNFTIFADLFKENGKLSHLMSADTSNNTFSFDVVETGNYILRLQPKLYNSGQYSLSVSIGPSIGFPVSGSKATVGSFWGDNRDGGKRLHEGIDIFAPKLTPAIAAADGVITGVREERLGGKTVWLRVDNKNFTLYYAHLDKQLVQEGQTVKKGEIVGLVGNTGNAKHTPSHLHFGVYTPEGPKNPFPFVNRVVKTAPSVPARPLAVALRLVKPQKTQEGILIKPETQLLPLAVNTTGYLAQLPDGSVIQTPFNAVKVLPEPLKQGAPMVVNVAASK